MESGLREQLINHLNELAVVRGKVTLSSGKEADYYIDGRSASLHGQASAVMGEVLLDLTSDVEFTAVGGLTLGADPVAYSMVAAAYRHGRTLNAFVVRKEAKTHGMQRQIEGPSIAGQRVVVVEDTSTTGQSVLKAVEAVKAAGAEIACVVNVIDRDSGAKALIESAGYEYRYAVSVHDLDVPK